MRKYILLAVLLFGFSAAGYTKTKSGYKIKDGLYLIVRLDTTEAQRSIPVPARSVVHFSRLFEDYSGDLETRIVIDPTDYVPLELDVPPATEQQTEAKKKLLLTLTPTASEKLKSFTAKHVMQHVVVVVNGEALTMHKIREAITSGQLQITRCTDNACEQLYFNLKGNLKKR